MTLNILGIPGRRKSNISRGPDLIDRINRTVYSEEERPALDAPEEKQTIRPWTESDLEFNFYKKEERGSFILKGYYELKDGTTGFHPYLRDLPSMLGYVVGTINHLREEGDISPNDLKVHLKSNSGSSSELITLEDLESLALELQEKMPKIEIIVE
jgi:hypothetical protein